MRVILSSTGVEWAYATSKKKKIKAVIFIAPSLTEKKLRNQIQFSGLTFASRSSVYYYKEIIMGYITVGKENSTDIKIHYEDHGQGEVVLMIHGYPFSGMAWEKEEARFLQEGYRVITYDRRGFGLSSKPTIGYDWDTFAQDLDKIMNELNLNNVTLVGHSMGTGELTRYLSKFGSKRVARAVFVSPIPPFLLKTNDNPSGVDKSVFDGFKEAIKNDRYAFITTFLKNFYNLGMISKHNLSEEKLRADFNLAASSSPTAFLNCVDTWTADFRQDLPNINVPSLIIQGDADKILPFEATGNQLVKKINARLKVIPGGSHGIPWTHAEEINETILNFIAETKKSSVSAKRAA